VTDRPFTVAVCQSGPCAPAGAELIERLAVAVRRCPYGVLVRVGCPLRAPRCYQDADRESGSYLLVQPCGLDRRPRGAAIVVGPVLSEDDVDAVATWLEDGDLNAGLLDRRLRVPVPAARPPAD
jgi:hypothetical protein